MISAQGFRSRPKKRESGMAVLLTVLTLPVVIGFTGLSIDAGVAYTIRGRLSAAMDAAALAAGRGLNLGSDVGSAQAAAISAATRFFNANFPAGYMQTDPATRTLTATFTQQQDGHGNPTGVLIISVTGSVTAPTYFVQVLGIRSITIASTGTATRKAMVMSLVLDRSASMGSRDTAAGSIPGSISSSSSSCESMVYSAIRFISNFTPYDYVGMVSFDYTAHNDYPPSTNFKFGGAAGVIQAIADIDCGNNTNTTAALELAYRQIQSINLPLAENVIVLFTDGVPNGVTADFPVRTSVDTRLGPSGSTPTPPNSPSGNRTNCLDGAGTLTCVNMPVACGNSPATVHGVITQTCGFNVNSGGRGGLYKAFDSDPNPSFPSGCPRSGMTMVNQTLAYIPDTDAFGNSTHGPWDGWLYQVNNKCAPNGTPITSGNSACKNLGDLWSNYPGTGAGAPNNTFQSGPYRFKFRPDLANTIGAVSMNTAVNEASKIRSDATYKIAIDTIYLQGNAGDPVDRQFLQLVSNQETILPIIYDAAAAPYPNPYYQASEQKGMYLATTSNLKLMQLFAQVASSLLRISQ